MLTLVFDGEPTAGRYLVHGTDSTIVAGIDRHWTRTSFVARTADGAVLCKVDRGGLIFVTWEAVAPDDRPLLMFTSKINGGNISFADGRSARLKRQFLGTQWSVVDGLGVVLASGVSDRSLWWGGGRGFTVSVDNQRLTVPEVVAIAEVYRIDFARRRRRPDVITDAVRRL